MTWRTILRIIAIVILITGILTFLKIGDELYTGILSGSRSYGLNVSSHPVVFYISIVLEGLIAGFLTVVAISLLRIKK